MEKSPQTKPEQESGTSQYDGTLKILERLGIPLTRENYLMLAFAGNPPAGSLKEPLEEELEEELPHQIQLAR